MAASVFEDSYLAAAVAEQHHGPPQQSPADRPRSQFGRQCAYVPLIQREHRFTPFGQVPSSSPIPFDCNARRMIAIIHSMNTTDLNLLRIFDALWRKRHVGEAASSVSLSQPAFSNALKRLRVQLGDPLFVKTRGGMQPTARASALAPVVSAALAQLYSALDHARSFHPATSTRNFVLSMSDVGEMVFLPKLLRHLARVAPGINIRTAGGTPGEIRRALEAGELDLLLGYFPDVAGSNMFQQRLFSHGFLCIARAGHPALRERLSRKAFFELPHASIRAEGRSQEIVEQYFKNRGLRRRTPLQTHHFLSIPFVVAATDMVVTVPAAVGEMFTALANIATFKPPVPLPSFEIRQHWHRRQHTDPEHQWLRREVVRLFANEKGWRA